MVVEGLVTHEVMPLPLTPTWLMVLPCPVVGLPETVEPAPAPVGEPAAGAVAPGLFNVWLPVGLGVTVTAAPPVAPAAGARVSAASARPVLPRSATVASKANRYLI